MLQKLDGNEYNNKIHMELLENPINDSSFIKICPDIITAFFKITSVYNTVRDTTNDFEKLYLNLLFTLLIRIKKLNEWKFIKIIIDNLNQKCQSNDIVTNLNYNNRILLKIYEIIGNDKNFLFPINNKDNNNNDDIEQSIKLIQTFTSMVLSKKWYKTYFTDSNINDMFKNLYSYKYSSDGLIAYSIKMFEFIKCDNYINDNGIRFQIWDILSNNLLTSIEFSTEKYFQLLLDYLYWPWNHLSEESVRIFVIC